MDQEFYPEWMMGRAIETDDELREAIACMRDVAVEEDWSAQYLKNVIEHIQEGYKDRDPVIEGQYFEE